LREEIRGSVAEDTVVKADCSESGVQKIRDITSPRVRGSDFRSEGGLEQELNQIGSAEEPERKKPRVSEGFQKKTGRKSRDEARAKECDLERNYWIEFWNAETKRWICIDPWLGTVDDPDSIEDGASRPVYYVLAVDNVLGLRDVTARYASQFLSRDMRLHRIDSRWWNKTLEVTLRGIYQNTRLDLHRKLKKHISCRPL
uniref:Rad4 domain-containing protein n=1 Tax=Enterobius vermicularis TaxID=51028 RepID=A0A0N4UW95_ENTVE